MIITSQKNSWKLPPDIKVYEALGAVGDNRLEINQAGAKVYSSSGNKFYAVVFDPTLHAITTNDNGSYWQGYLGYPAIAYLLKIDLLKTDPKWFKKLAGIKWKDINTKHKNNFEKTKEYIHSTLGREEKNELINSVQEILNQLQELSLTRLPSTLKPPSGY